MHTETRDYSPEKWLYNRIYYPSNRSKQIKETHAAYSAGTQYTRQSLNEMASQTETADGTPPNPSTIDVMVGSPSKKQTRVRDMLQSFGNLFLVRLVIYYEFERV